MSTGPELTLYNALKDNDKDEDEHYIVQKQKRPSPLAHSSHPLHVPIQRIKQVDQHHSLVTDTTSPVLVKSLVEEDSSQKQKKRSWKLYFPIQRQLRQKETQIVLFLIALLIFGINQSAMNNQGTIPKMSPLPPSPGWIGDDAKSNQFAVFYHVYLGMPAGINSSTKDGALFRRHSYTIIEDQLRQVGSSFAASSGDLKVYYNIIGEDLDSGWIHDICTQQQQSLTCQRLDHYRFGFEDKTLNAIKQYCQDHPDFTIVYLHNKGSMHTRKRTQTNWRRAMTAAVTSKLCLEPFDSHYPDANQCNACGLLFQPLPGPHFPGNMWSSKCSYINKLLTPEEYHKKRQKVADWIEVEKNRGTFAANLFPMEPHFTGEERYESEYWIASHPSLFPCDVSKTANLKYWHVDQKTKHLKLVIPKDYSKDFQFSLAPRHSIKADWIWYSYANRTDFLSDNHNNSSDEMKDLRMLDYFLLRGMLARWQLVYNQLPTTARSIQNQWVWSWFPDGELWRQGVEKYGTNAIYELIKDIGR